MAFTRPVSLCFAFISFFSFSGECNWCFHGVSYLASQAPPDGMQDIIWAFSRTPPESADADADISVHHFFGSSALDLTRTTGGAVSEDDPLPSPAPSAEAGGDEVDADVGKTTGPARGGGVARVVHAGLCILAFLLVIPFGALVVRYAKATGSSAAFDLHRYLQFGVGELRVLVRVLLLTYLTYSPRILFVSVLVTFGCGLSFGPFPLLRLLQLAHRSLGVCSRTFLWIATTLGKHTRYVK